MKINLHRPTFSCLCVMLRADVGTVIWALNMGIPCGSRSKYSSLKLMASIFKRIEIATHISFSIFTILMVWGRTWNKLSRLQNLKMQTMLKIIFLVLNKNFQSYTSSSASHCSYFPPYCFTKVLKKCWLCSVLWE